MTFATVAGWECGKIISILTNWVYNCDALDRKPEPEFYLAACSRNNLKPHEVIFLDDIGMYASFRLIQSYIWLLMFFQ